MIPDDEGRLAEPGAAGPEAPLSPSIPLGDVSVEDPIPRPDSQTNVKMRSYYS
jgi:hypothetical protein